MLKEMERKKKRLQEKEAAEKKRKEEEKKKLEEKKKKKEQPVVTNESEPNVHHHHVLTDQSNISSRMNLTRRLPLAGPIGPPTKTVNKPLMHNEHTHRSFFSKNLFEQPTNKRYYETSTKRQSNHQWTDGK